MLKLALVSLVLVALPACSNLFHRSTKGHTEGKTETKTQGHTEGHSEAADRAQ